MNNLLLFLFKPEFRPVFFHSKMNTLFKYKFEQTNFPGAASGILTIILAVTMNLLKLNKVTIKADIRIPVHLPYSF